MWRMRHSVPCPSCKQSTSTLESDSDASGGVKRRRCCNNCGKRFNTRETQVITKRDRGYKKHKLKVGYLIAEIWEEEMERKVKTPYENIIAIFEELKKNDFKIRSYEELSKKVHCNEWTVTRVCNLLHVLGIINDPRSEGKIRRDQGLYNPRGETGIFEKARHTKKIIKRIKYFKETFGVEGKLKI